MCLTNLTGSPFKQERTIFFLPLSPLKEKVQGLNVQVVIEKDFVLLRLKGYAIRIADGVDFLEGLMDEGVGILPEYAPVPHHHVAVDFVVDGLVLGVVHVLSLEYVIQRIPILPTGQGQAGDQQGEGQQERRAGSLQSHSCVCHWIELQWG